jgi:ribosomal protein L16 Arg81 hydroxylase
MSSMLTSSVSTTQSGGLQRLLNTCDVTTFLRDYIGEQMLHVSGARERWADLFSWRELNAILNEGAISHPRVRLVKEGVDVDPILYTYERSSRQWPETRRCHQLMAEGATLIVTNIDSINSRLEAFVRELECDLSADVRVDVVATCASTPGLKMHWDDSECFNVQLDGEKRWQVVRPERPYPLTATQRFPQRKDAVKKPAAPDGSPTWEGKLAPGDLIYLPRGWWHAVTPQLAPSLHLSFAVDVPTLADFLQWFAQEATQQESARRPLPVWQSPDERRDSIREALASLTSMLSTEKAETYLAQLTNSAPARPDFALPEAGLPGAPHVDSRTMVRLQSTRPLRWTLEGETLVFEWNGQPYRFHAETAPVLQKLEAMRALTLDELSDGRNRLLVRAFVLVLLTTGLLGITERTPSDR